MFSPPQLGEAAELRHVVSESDTSHDFGNLSVESLASPRLQHWIERTAAELWKTHRDNDEVLLGIDFRFQHTAPSPVGATVTTRLTVIAVDGRKTSYRIEAWDDVGPICEGTYDTFLMPIKRYLTRVRERSAKIAAPSGR